MNEKPKTDNRLTTYIVMAIVLIPSIYGVIAWLDNRIESTIQKPEFISRIAAQIRPSAIVDGKGSVIADMGAMKYLDQITVSQDKRLIITVVPNRHLSVAPIVTPLDNTAVLESAVRGEKFTWIFTFRIGGMWVMSDDAPSAMSPFGGASPENRYRIEILD
ncbi:MAG TPA: hypothetical protein PKE26_16630 [Kiritimatiellia bacterium]|nr:hypothetical protein [Kiritimatiellia bacterium]HMP00723.1 hypothetical protein [Kiritimatiellia bacterium]